MMFLLEILKQMIFFTGSYSNQVFPEPLSDQEEHECIIKMLNHDEMARNKLIEHNLRLVAHIVKKFDVKDSETDDLISIGTIGLIKGVDSYNLDKNIKLTTYIAKCIQNEILMYFRSIKGENGKNVSLNESICYDKDGNEINLIDVVKDKNEDFDTLIHSKDNIALLTNFLNILTPREKAIIIKRYGLYNQKEQTQKEIAKDMKISRSYVSRIEKRALTKMLREFIKSNNVL